jgi:arylsulfatase A-like enzyme
VTEAVIRLYLDDPQNRVIVLWFNEPDSSQHYFGLGSPEAVAAMRGVDHCVALLLDALDQRGLRDQFDLFFISDHGHSTVRAHNTLRSYLAEAFTEIGDQLPLVTASDYIYVQPGATPPTAKALMPLIDWLVAQPWAGVVMAGDPALERLPGVIPLTALWQQQRTVRTPLLAVSPRWSNAPNEFGVPGEVMSLTTQAALRSSHGSASPFDLHAVLIANGPNFHSGHSSQIPTGAIDLLPTILHLLGITPPPALDGRILWELLAKPAGEPGEIQRSTIEPLVPNRHAAHRAEIAIHRVGATSYVHGALQENAFYAGVGPRT